MSIIPYKKMARKSVSAVLQLSLFAMSLMFGFLHSINMPIFIVIVMLSACLINIFIIQIESRMYPDLQTIAEDQRENDTFPDKPYTCMFNPILPCLGIFFSGTVIGYLDIIVWTSFLGVMVLIGASYFVYVIPRKYEEKINKVHSRMGSCFENI